MKISILDYKHSAIDSWFSVLKKLADSNGIERVRFENPSPNLESFLKSLGNAEDVCVFLHCSNPQEWDASQDKGVLKAIIVHVGTHGSVHPEFKANSRRHLCPLTAEQFSDSVGLKVLQTIGSGKPNWELLTGKSFEYIHALSLLCQAWLLTGGEPTQEKFGITLNAPVKPKDWFEPFDETPSSVAVKNIAQHMSTAAKATEEFLNDVLKLAQDGKGERIGVDFQKKIKDLQDALQVALR